MQDAARYEYAHAMCTLGEIVPSGYGWKVMRQGLPGYWDAACSPAGDKYQIAPKLESQIGRLTWKFVPKRPDADAARDECAHVLGTLRSMPASRKPRRDKNDSQRYDLSKIKG
jgi:hypothetical protein